MERDAVRIKLPEDVRKIISMIESSGHEAFAVGGCVRDSLLGSEPNDWDLCTDAVPSEMFDIFGAPCSSRGEWRTIDTGSKHGTVTVLREQNMYEVTTYRVDGKYTDSRHPSSVRFTPDIEDDLARRDFTINAMAYNEDRGLVDLYGGMEDLKAGVIRCVGKPPERFLEDALRIMRAMRFSSQLGFTIDTETFEAMKKYAYLLNGISAERVREEFVKTLCGAGSMYALDPCRDIIAAVIPEAAPMFDLDQKNDYHCYDVWQHTLHAVHYVVNTPALKVAAFFHDIGKPPCMTVTEDDWGHFYGHEHKGAEIAETVMKRLKFDNKTTDLVKELIWNHGIVFQQTERHARRMLNKFGEAKLHMLIELELADVSSQAPFCVEERVANIEAFRAIAKDVIAQKQCFSIHDMAVNGNDLMAEGVPQGPELGALLQKLFELVLDKKIPNDKEALMEEVRKCRQV